MNAIDIFSAGAHTAMSGVKLSFSEADLEATVSAYDPALHEAPIVVGHPKHDAPAYGWVRTLVRDGATLRAVPDQIDPAFAELVAAGRYKKISASFYHPDAEANPAPGTYYLRHVGFLGAQPPAVKGLRDAQFGEEEAGVVTLEFADPHPPEEPMDKPSNTPPKREPLKPDAVDFAEREAALAARQAKLDAREKALAEQEASARRRAHVEFAERLITEGRLLPKDRDGLIEFLAAQPAETAIEFGEGDSAFKGAALDWLTGFLSTLPQQVDFAERAAPEQGSPSSKGRFAAPAEAQVDPERLALHGRALAYQEAHPGVSYADAVLTVQGA
ncbi:MULTISPECIES: peptidase [Marichromatium]|uniref:Peptidase n=1 Tax=Marichromatium gracile TaxID=1048 RepID=A0A4R4A4I9_MARGR|nr:MULTISPECIES: peptidase [Marichromatium]MBK1709808.1 hypothetical protein [Marichromatium gracile]RNE89971.1 peptidase [Marichromatium sp. AB31]TCW32682.1 hypothetical protein EDC29_11748 [Marichromatium gracile]